MSDGRAEDPAVLPAAPNGTALAASEPSAEAIDLAALCQLLSQAAGELEAAVPERQASTSEPGPAGEVPVATDAQDVARLIEEIGAIVAQVAEHAATPPAVAAVAEPRPTASRVVRTPQAERVARKRAPIAPERRAKKQEARTRFAMLGLVLLMSSVIAPILSHASPGHAYTIASNSMAPTMPMGSFVIAGPGEVHDRDVVVYLSPLTGTYQVHRIVEIRHEGGNVSYIARGDSNDAPDSLAIQPHDIKGVVKFNAPFVGYLWLMPVWLQAGIFVAFTLVYILITLWDARDPASRRRIQWGAVALVLVVLFVFPYAGASIGNRYSTSAETFNVATPPMPFAAGNSTGVTTGTTDGGNVATVTAPAPRLIKEIEMWGCLASNSCDQAVASAAFVRYHVSQVRINAANYPAGTKWFLEALVKAPAGQNITVKLHNQQDNVVVANSQVATTTTSFVWIRSASSFSLAGDKRYEFKALTSAGGAGTIRSVRLIAVQDYPTVTETQIRLATNMTTASATNRELVGSAHFAYDSTQFDGTVTWALDAVYSTTGTVVGNGQIHLVRGNAGGINFANVSMAATASPTHIRVVATGAPKTGEYHIEGGAPTGVAPTLRIHSAHMVIIQAAGTVTKTVNVYGLAPTNTTASGSYVTIGYGGAFDGERHFSNAAVSLAATLNRSVAGAAVGALQLLKPDGSVVVGSGVDQASAAKAFYESGNISAQLDQANGTYYLQAKTTGGTLTVHSAWIKVTQKLTQGHRYDNALDQTQSTGCSWTYFARKLSSDFVGGGRMRGATVELRGGNALATQIVWDGSSFTQTQGSSVTVTSGTQLDEIITSNPSSAGTSSLVVQIVGSCGGVHTVQQVTYTLT